MAEEVATEETGTRDEFTVGVVVTRNDEVEVPVEISLRYPAGFGLTAARAITNDSPELFSGMANELLQRGDSEAVAAFVRMRDNEEAGA